MKRIVIIASLFSILTAFTVAVSTTWQNDDMHSQLGFTVTHLGINDISGTFNDIDVTVQSTKGDFSDARFELNAKAASLDTRVEPRNKHLKSADFFDVEKFPTISFKSTGIKPASKNQFKLTGDLTMHGITKQVTMDLLYKGTVENPMNKKATSAFQITGIIKRSDFGVGEKFPSAVISDEVRIKADGEFGQNETK